MRSPEDQRGPEDVQEANEERVKNVIETSLKAFMKSGGGGYLRTTLVGSMSLRLRGGMRARSSRA